LTETDTTEKLNWKKNTRFVSFLQFQFSVRVSLYSKDIYIKARSTIIQYNVSLLIHPFKEDVYLYHSLDGSAIHGSFNSFLICGMTLFLSRLCVFFFQLKFTLYVYILLLLKFKKCSFPWKSWLFFCRLQGPYSWK
jgi:hypothetical protein